MSDENAPHNARQKKLLLLVGPTGVGKTAVAIELCALLGGEVISADSMQLYRGLDIGTAKASPEEQERARHHLIDILAPDAEYSAARWAEDARRAIHDIQARGKHAVIVGGTGFYLTALLFPQRLASTPPDAQLRAELQEIAQRDGNEVLHARLRELDADAAERLHPNDTYRVIRAIEVASNKPHLTQDQSTPSDDSAWEFVAFGLSLPREELYARLDERVDKMLAAGFMEELRALVAGGFGDASPLQNLGYRHMQPALQDATTFDAAIELWKRDTRRYAKRQMTWFRHQIPVQWIDMSNKSVLETARLIAQEYSVTPS